MLKICTVIQLSNGSKNIKRCIVVKMCNCRIDSDKNLKIVHGPPNFLPCTNCELCPFYCHHLYHSSTFSSFTQSSPTKIQWNSQFLFVFCLTKRAASFRHFPNYLKKSPTLCFLDATACRFCIPNFDVWRLKPGAAAFVAHVCRWMQKAHAMLLGKREL